MSSETQSVLESQTTEEALRLREVYKKSVLDYVKSLQFSHSIPENYISDLQNRLELISGPFYSEADAEDQAFKLNEAIHKYAIFYRKLKDWEASTLKDIEELKRQVPENTPQISETDSVAALITLKRIELLRRMQELLEVIRADIENLDKLDAVGPAL
jgi:predicted transcriptional regulator